MAKNASSTTLDRIVEYESENLVGELDQLSQ